MKLLSLRCGELITFLNCDITKTKGEFMRIDAPKILAALACVSVIGGVLMLDASVGARANDQSAFAGGSNAVSITIGSSVPSELNPPYHAGKPPTGGAPNATPEQADAFAWQEFIALNWAAGPQQGKFGQRDTPSSSCRFGDPGCTGPTTWETFRGKVETFPGNSQPPGYVQNASQHYGYDALPQYNYIVPVSACDPSQANDPVPWVNLDETDQITLDNMYAGVVQPSSSPGNSAPQLIRFLAKSNELQYFYVAANSDPNNPLQQWWNNIPLSVVTATKNYLAANQSSPPSGSSSMVSQYDGTIEVKAAWRPLNPSEIKSGHFHTQPVRFYEKGSSGTCYRDATWGLVALHIIQKTPSAPYFIYATFEQSDNLLSASGKPIEDTNGNLLPPVPGTATTPQVCLIDPKPASSASSNEMPSNQGSVILTDNPATCLPAKSQTFCASPGAQLFYHNTPVTPPTPNSEPSGGNICVNKRENAIPGDVIAANTQAHAAMAAYFKSKNIGTSPWLYYKLVNVQYFPYDKAITTVTPNGSLYTGKAPYTAQHPSPATYYQANIVVETNRSLQLFSGGLSPNIATDWNQDGSEHKNSYYAGGHYNMGGCMGCHGSQGQNPAGQAGDFSVILARGSVAFPETPSLETSKGLTQVRRNRSLTK